MPPSALYFTGSITELADFITRIPAYQRKSLSLIQFVNMWNAR